MRFFLLLAPALVPLATRPSAQAQVPRFGLVHQMLPAEGAYSRSVVLGDVDRDGDLDAFVGMIVDLDSGASALHLYLNDGTGIFADVTPTNLPQPFDDGYAVALGDVDGDGDLDACLAGEQGRLFLNDGAGVFADATPTHVPPTFRGGDVDLGDLDGDGDLDAYLAGAFYGSLFLNDGAGVFADVSATNLPMVFYAFLGPRSIELGDVDGDGDLDALGVGGYPGNIAICTPSLLLLNDGNGVFTLVMRGSIPGSCSTQAAAFGDVDGDGDLDALLSQYPYGLLLFSNDGAGMFANVTATSLPACPGVDLGCPYVSSIALADVDGDGDLDAFMGKDVHEVGGALQDQPDALFLNDGTGVFADVSATHLPGILDGTGAVALGDLDGDGDLDALLGNGRAAFTGIAGVAYGVQDRLYLNDGSGAFGDATSTGLPAVIDYTTSVALGDVDGDSDLDLFVGSGGSGPDTQKRLYLNESPGVFSDVTSTHLPESSIFEDTRAVALGDLDGDGDLDAISANFDSSAPPIDLYSNDGTGNYADVTATNLPAPPSYGTQAVALGDVDGDGDRDAFFGGIVQPDLLYRNDGAGIYADVTATNLPSSPCDTQAIAFGDVDDDGDLDAFLGSDSESLLLNDGAGIFTDVSATNLPPSSNARTQAIALGDVDGDGDLDAFLGHSHGGGPPGQQASLFLNDGTGFFTDVSAARIPALLGDTAALALGDVDEDGDLDVFLGNSDVDYGTGVNNHLLLNDGTGSFTDVADLPALLEDTRAVALGDLDGDGDLDAFAGSRGNQDRIYTNLSRQLAWRGTPRVGKPLTLDIWGPESGTWVLGASVAIDGVVRPRFDRPRLDLMTSFVIGRGDLDGQGRASITFLVPQDPDLVGTSVSWQTLVGPPLRWTNLEITTLTNL